MNKKNDEISKSVRSPEEKSTSTIFSEKAEFAKPLLEGKASSDIVQVRMRPDTIDQVDQLQKRVHSSSRSDAIRRAVEISSLLVNAIEHGDRIIIEGKNGKQRQILITGLNR